MEHSIINQPIQIIQVFKLDTSRFLDEDFSNPDIPKIVEAKILKGIQEQIQFYLIGALRNVGYEFSSSKRAREFIKDNCRHTNKEQSKEIVYFVDDQPIMLHNYGVDSGIEQTHDDEHIIFTAKAGYIAFIINTF